MHDVIVGLVAIEVAGILLVLATCVTDKFIYKWPLSDLLDVVLI